MRGVEQPVARQNDTGPDTTALYAWLGRDDDGQEGTVMFPDGRGGVLPLIFTSEDRARSCRGLMGPVAAARGFPVRLVRFVRDVTVDEVGPG